MNSRAALLILVSTLLLTSEAPAEPKWSDDPPKIDVAADRNRAVRTQGGDWDDKEDRMQMKITIRNKDLNAGAEGLKGEFWLITRSAVDQRVYQIAQRESFTFSLSAEREGRKFIHETPEIILRFDRTGAVFGTRYHAWILAVTDAKDELIAVKSSSSFYEKLLEQAMGLKVNDWVDSNLRPSSEPQS